jgi:uncharacterized membrane protein
MNRTVWSWLVFYTLFLCLGCGRITNSSSEDKSVYTPRINGRVEFELAQAIIINKCSECHAGWTSYTESDYQLTGLVVAGNLTGSRLYYRNQLAPGPDNNMPTLGRSAMTATELQIIADWINSIL